MGIFGTVGNFFRKISIRKKSQILVFVVFVARKYLANPEMYRLEMSEVTENDKDRSFTGFKIKIANLVSR